MESQNMIFVPDAVQPVLTPAIICDLDGTLCLRGDRDPFDHSVAMEDAVNPSVATVLHKFKDSHKILFVSGREEKWRIITEYWLWKHGFDFYHALWMRPTDDQRNDGDVKEEIWHWNIENQFNVLFVMDDRIRVVERWRQLGQTVFQVAPGAY